MGFEKFPRVSMGFEPVAGSRGFEKSVGLCSVEKLVKKFGRGRGRGFFNLKNSAAAAAAAF